MSFLHRFRSSPTASSVQMAEKVAECLQEIASEPLELVDVETRRNVLLLGGTDVELAALAEEAAAIRLRTDRARAVLPMLKKQLEEKRAEERGARLKVLLSELEAVVPPYLEAMKAIPAVANEVVRVRGLIEAEFSAEATAIPGPVVLAVDLNSIRGLSGKVASPTQLLDFEVQLQEAIAHIRRKAVKQSAAPTTHSLAAPIAEARNAAAKAIPKPGRPSAARGPATRPIQAQKAPTPAPIRLIPDTNTLTVIMLRSGFQHEGVGIGAGATVTLPREAALACMQQSIAELVSEPNARGVS